MAEPEPGMVFDVEMYCLDNLDKAGKAGTRQILATCPWCSKSGTFYVSIKTGHYICHSCQEKGKHLVGVVAQVEGVSWRQARELILKRSLDPRRSDETSTLTKKIASLNPFEDEGYKLAREIVQISLPNDFKNIYTKGKWRVPVYLKQRGIKKQTAKTFHMGYCNHGKYAHRLIIPARCPNGFSFTARAMDNDMFPRYLNPEAAGHGRLLLGWNTCVLDKDLTICEGPLDAVRLYQHGIQAVALMGKVASADQMAMFFTLPRDIGITIMLDPEEIEAPYEIAKRLISRFDNVYIAKLPAKVDPGASTRAQAHEAYSAAKRYTGERIAVLPDKMEELKKKMAARWS